MNKKILIITIIILVFAGIYFIQPKNVDIDVQTSTPTESISTSTKSFDPKNASYEIEGETITLKDGIAKTGNIITRYFGNMAIGDLNADGMSDFAFLITQDPGGSGTFYYVVVVLRTKDGYKTTNTFFVGDRIAPQSTEIHSDSMELRVNYAERRAGEPMTTQPSMGATLFLKVTYDDKLEGLMK